MQYSSGGLPSFSANDEFAEQHFLGSQPAFPSGELGKLAALVRSTTSKLSDDEYFSMDQLDLIAAPNARPNTDPIRKRKGMVATASTPSPPYVHVEKKTRPSNGYGAWDRDNRGSSGTAETPREVQLRQQAEQLQSTAQDKRGMPPSRRPPLIPLMAIDEIPIGGITRKADWNKYHDLLFDLDALPEWANPADPPRRHTFGDSIAVHRVLGLDEDADIRRVNSPICLHYARDGFFSRKNMTTAEPPYERKREMMKRMQEEYAATHEGRVLTEKMMKDFDDSLIDRDREMHEQKYRERLALATKRREAAIARGKAVNPSVAIGNWATPGDDKVVSGGGCKCTTQ